jgi:hypothetical protein
VKGRTLVVSHRDRVARLRVEERIVGPRTLRDPAHLTGKTNGRKIILNALTVHYGDRITATN